MAIVLNLFQINNGNTRIMLSDIYLLFLLLFLSPLCIFACCCFLLTLIRSLVSGYGILVSLWLNFTFLMFAGTFLLRTNLFAPFHVNVLFPYPLKTLESLKSSVFLVGIERDNWSKTRWSPWIYLVLVSLLLNLKHRNYDTVQADLMVLFNPLQPGVALLCPLKTSENL